jgi:hypothetical protein
MDDVQRIYPHIVRRLQRSDELTKIAGDEALIHKAANDMAVMALLKHAAMGPLGKGLMYGAGAAVPAGLVGGALLHQAGNESRRTVEDIRNKALQTALGVAAIGGGLYALHRTMTPKTKSTTSYSQGPDGTFDPYFKTKVKLSAAQPDTAQLIEKLATVGFLDILFENQHTHGQDDETRKTAAECQLLNAEHGADILRQLLD